MANSTERIGVHHCGEVVEANGWMFREQDVDDVGIDAYIEFTENDGKSRQLLALQIKSASCQEISRGLCIMSSTKAIIWIPCRRGRRHL